jgi:gas vesicle protein
LVGKDGLSRSTQVPAGGAGDMHKSVYDQDNDGIVDNSEKLGGYTVDELPISVDTQEALDDIQEELEYLQQDIEEEVEKREDADEVLQSNIDQLAEDIEDDYVKKNYALGDTSNNYKMIKAISWKVDTNGVIKFHIVSRDLS